MKALNNLIEQIKLMLPTAFDMKLYVDDPALPEGGGRGFLDELDSRMLCLRYCTGSRADLERHKFYYDKVENAKLVNKLKAVPNNNYIINFNVLYEKNEITLPFFSFIAKNLVSLGLSDDEVEEYEKTNIPVLRLCFKFPYSLGEMGIDELSYDIDYVSRASEKEISNLLHKLSIMFSDYFSNFQIVDNLGVKSSFNAKTLYQYAFTRYLLRNLSCAADINEEKLNPYIKLNKRPQNNFAVIKLDSLDGFYQSREQNLLIIIDNTPFVNSPYGSSHAIFARGEGLFAPVVIVDYDYSGQHTPGSYTYGHEFTFGRINQDMDLMDLQGDNHNSVFYNWKIGCLIPQDKISQYTNFKVIPKH